MSDFNYEFDYACKRHFRACRRVEKLLAQAESSDEALLLGAAAQAALAYNWDLLMRWQQRGCGYCPDLLQYAYLNYEQCAHDFTHAWIGANYSLEEEIEATSFEEEVKAGKQIILSASFLLLYQQKLSELE